MYENMLKNNIEKLMKENNLDVFTLERKAGVRRGSIYNITKGKSKKPSAELLQSIADVFGITVKDLYELEADKIHVLCEKDVSLLVKITEKVAREIINQNLKASCPEITAIINESYNYSIGNDFPDERFIKWRIKQKIREKQVYLEN